MPSTYPFRVPRSNEVARRDRNEAYFLRQIIRERGYWLSPMLADLPLPTERPSAELVETPTERNVAPHHRGPRLALPLVEEPVVVIEAEDTIPEPAPLPLEPLPARVQAIKGGAVVLRPVDPAKAAAAIAAISKVAQEKADAEAAKLAKTRPETKAERRKDQIRRANAKLREKQLAEAAMVADLLEERKATSALNRRARDRRRAEDADGVAPLPTAKELVDEARLASIVEKIEHRRNQRREAERRRRDRRKVQRKATKLENLRAQAIEPGQAERRLVEEPDLARLWSQYLDHNLANHVRYHKRNGRDLSEERVAAKRADLEAVLLARLDVDPMYLYTWAEKRAKAIRAHYEKVSADPVLLADYNAKRLAHYHKKKAATSRTEPRDGSTDR